MTQPKAIKKTYKIGDVIKINIQGTIVTGVILSDIIIDYYLEIGGKYLVEAKRQSIQQIKKSSNLGHVVRTAIYPGFWLNCCYLVLIGDEKIYVEESEIHQNEADL